MKNNNSNNKQLSQTIQNVHIQQQRYHKHYSQGTFSVKDNKNIITNYTYIR